MNYNFLINHLKSQMFNEKFNKNNKYRSCRRCEHVTNSIYTKMRRNMEDKKIIKTHNVKSDNVKNNNIKSNNVKSNDEKNNNTESDNVKSNKAKSSNAKSNNIKSDNTKSNIKSNNIETKGITKLKRYIEENSCQAEELERRLSKNPLLYQGYLALSGEWKRRFQEYMAGKKTLPLTYDPFFKKLFSVDIHSERLSDFISSVLGEKVTVKCMLPNENRIVNEASLLIMDMLVELEDGSLVNVEIQKIPYTFPGQRITCYLADTMTRQYAKVKSEKGNYFTYKDLNKVITIVIYENSPSICKSENLKSEYLHKGRMKFDTGLDMEMYQECYIIALDEFKKSEYYLSNDKGNNKRTDVNAWLSLLVTDDIEKIDRNIEKYPWLEEIYIEMAEYLVKPEEVFDMYSEALRILDENTVKYMVDELKDENKELRGENTELKGKNTQLEGENTELKGMNVELNDKIIDFQKKQLQQDKKEKEVIKNMYKANLTIEQIVEITGDDIEVIKNIIK